MAEQVSRSHENLDPFDPEKLRLTDDILKEMKCQKRCKDMVNSPPHYTQHPSGIECIQVTEHMSFNVGNARAVITIYGLAQTVVRVLGSRSPISFVPRPGPDVELRVPSVEKARRLVGFEASIDLEEGIQRTAEYLLASDTLDLPQGIEDRVRLKLKTNREEAIAEPALAF